MNDTKNAQICGEIGEVIGREAACKESLQVGNSEKMREALSDACYAMHNFLKTQNGGCDEMAKALDKAKSALSAPPRNCDVGTPDEQCERHNRWCYHERNKKCAAIECVLCFAKWSQMPHEEGEAK